jgi:AcrR family transcriptional regulator
MSIHPERHLSFTQQPTGNLLLLGMAEVAITHDSVATEETIPSRDVPSTCPGPLDPRIRRTRELLQQALATLLDSREFERISVQDITDAATLNRATFYAHYPDKFALLNCLVAGRFRALLAARGVFFDGACLGALQGIVLGVCDYLAQTLNQPSRAAIDRQRAASDRQLEPHLESAVVAVVSRMLLQGLQQHPPAGNLSPALLASTAGWAIYGAAKEWVHTPNRPSSEDFAAVVVGLVAPILNAPISLPTAGSLPASA